VSQPPILIYTTAVCPYCVAAKNLLKARGLGYNEMRVDSDPERVKPCWRAAPGGARCRRSSSARGMSAVSMIWLRPIATVASPHG